LYLRSLRIFIFPRSLSSHHQNSPFICSFTFPSLDLLCPLQWMQFENNLPGPKPDPSCYTLFSLPCVSYLTQRMSYFEHFSGNIFNLKSSTKRRPPLWSSGQKSWLQVQRSEFDSRRYQTFYENYWVWNGVYSDSLVQLRFYLEEKVGAPVYKTENTSVGIRCTHHVAPSRDPLRSPRGTLCQQKLALTSPTSGGRSVGYSSLVNSDHRVLVLL
jgi:hypothetical protein